MTKDEMRAIFLRSLGFAPGDVDGAEIDIYLQKIWQRDIPNRIGDNASESYFDFDLQVDRSEYSYAFIDGTDPPEVLIRSVTGPIVLGSDKLEVYTNSSHFHDQYPTETDGTPLAVLVYNRKLRFMPIPQAIETCRVYCHKFNEKMEDIGLPEDTQAFCVIYGAVALRAAEAGMDDIQQRFDGLYRIALAEVASMFASGVRVSAPPGDRW